MFEQVSLFYFWVIEWWKLAFSPIEIHGDSEIEKVKFLKTLHTILTYHICIELCIFSVKSVTITSKI